MNFAETKAPVLRQPALRFNAFSVGFNLGTATQRSPEGFRGNAGLNDEIPSGFPTRRLRVGGETLTAPRHGGVLVGPDPLRQVFNDAQARSAPSRQNRFRFHDLFRRTGKVEFEFSRVAGDQDFDGVETAGDHPEAELFRDFTKSVLLEAISHA